MPRCPSTELTLTTIGRLPAFNSGTASANHLGRREEIDLHDLPQPLGRGLGKAPHRADAGVVDQQVEPAEDVRTPARRPPRGRRLA